MTCRFCKKHEYTDDDWTPDNMVKYEVRHYAHHECFLKAKGEAGLRALPAWNVGKFPYKLLEKYGLSAVAKEITATFKEAA